MKTKTIILITALSFVLCSCKANVETAAREDINTEEVKEESGAIEEIKADSDEEPGDSGKNGKEEIIEEQVDDPLAGNESVVFIGDKDRGDNNTRKLVAFVLDKMTINPMEVSNVCAGDFDLNGTDEAFVFVGKKSDDEYEDYYEGDFYYTDGEGVERLEESNTGMWQDMGRFFDCGKRKYFVVSTHFTTGACSALYSVRDGGVSLDNISDLGYISEYEGGFNIVDSCYDGCYEVEDKILLGHTWKSYDACYDEKLDQIVECSSEEIDVDELHDYCGADIPGELSKLNGYIISAYHRSNGMVNINYLVSDAYQIDFRNASWNMNKSAFEKGWGDGDTEFQKSDEGGYYRKNMTDCVADSVDVSKPKSKRILLTAYERNNGIYYNPGEVILFGKLDQEEENFFEQKAFFIDKDTVLDYSDGGSFGGIQDGMSALEWIQSLINADDEMIASGYFIQGVYDLQVTGSHVDRIYGQYWWD